MMKRGRPKGVQAEAPLRGSVTEKAVAAFTRNPRSPWEIARALRPPASPQSVRYALNRWMPKWKKILKASKK